MSLLPLLLELQSVHDNLRVIERDLSAFPPDMAKLHTELQTLTKQETALAKVAEEAGTKAAQLQGDLKAAQVLEESSKKAVKAATTKVQFTAAIREQDERERAVSAIQKPLKELTSKAATATAEREALIAKHTATQQQFDELHQVFLAEHSNQVEARERLRARRIELEAELPATELARFNRILAARQGKAIAAVENSTCTGCRTKLRIPHMTELRDKGMVTCESCQRFLHLPAKA